MKATIAACQPWFEIRLWASGDASINPSEPTDPTAPIARVRRAGDTVRDATFIATLEAVHERARPMQRPVPTMSREIDVACKDNQSPST